MFHIKFFVKQTISIFQTSTFLFQKMAGKSGKRKASHKFKSAKKEADNEYSDESDEGSSQTKSVSKNKKAKRSNSVSHLWYN